MCGTYRLYGTGEENVSPAYGTSVHAESETPPNDH